MAKAAAERMMAGVMATARDRGWLQTWGAADLFESNTGLRAWWADWRAKHRRDELRADLTARRDRERAAVAATERELAALTGDKVS